MSVNFYAIEMGSTHQIGGWKNRKMHQIGTLDERKMHQIGRCDYGKR